MSAATEFWSVVKFFGPLALIQAIAYVAAVYIASGNHGVIFVSQLTVTLIAASAGYHKGQRDSQGDSKEEVA